MARRRNQPKTKVRRKSTVFVLRASTALLLVGLIALMLFEWVDSDPTLMNIDGSVFAIAWMMVVVGSIWRLSESQTVRMYVQCRSRRR